MKRVKPFRLLDQPTRLTSAGRLVPASYAPVPLQDLNSPVSLLFYYVLLEIPFYSFQGSVLSELPGGFSTCIAKSSNKMRFSGAAYVKLGSLVLCAFRSFLNLES